jgi:hypothetical protein
VVRLNVYPVKSTFAPGETVELIAEIEAEATVSATAHLSIWLLATRVVQQQVPISLVPGPQTVALRWEPTSSDPRG